MNSAPHDLNRIRVQTARMLEIYALLYSELENNAVLSTSSDERAHLTQAIDTIAASMKQLQQYLDFMPEENSLNAEEIPQNLDEIVDAVLKLHIPNKEGE